MNNEKYIVSEMIIQLGELMHPGRIQCGDVLKSATGNFFLSVDFLMHNFTSSQQKD